MSTHPLIVGDRAASLAPMGGFEDVMDAGDTVLVKVLGVDDRGTIRVSRRQAATRSAP